VRLTLKPDCVDSYRLFLRAKSLPRYRVEGRTVEFPDEYAGALGLAAPDAPTGDYAPRPWMFDYQKDIAALAIRKRKFAVFMDCGLGKTAVLLEFARHAASVLPAGQSILIVSPLMVVRQTIAEAARFYGDLPIDVVRAADLPAWMNAGGRIGITNYEAVTDRVRPGRLGALILDESSMLKSHYGKWGRRLIDLGRGLPYKLCLTGTPAPNDRIEYANHAVFLDQFPTVNAFLARYFVNRGQTDNRWELKPHALRPFYTALSHWCVFVTNPAVYGWKDNAGSIPPIHVHVHDVPLTQAQRALVHRAGGDMYGTPGGITSRAVLSQLAKGRFKGKTVPSEKPQYVRGLVDSWPGEGTIVWCVYNREQDAVAAALPGCASMRGETPDDERQRMIDAFKSGECPTLVSKSKILGFGLNLQRATRQVFSGLVDSYESYYQSVKRSNRVGSTRPLNVHIPVTEIERPMVETVLRKAARVQADTEEQERIFMEARDNV
jgi:superfamily II DNA or RNA helicase